ncbi:hypothetical protein ACFORJ_07220 [Corynebacterium hansenii]|uniref:Uncharacterized protein n=1 Tax=Corynebacterium hansenii TaxID=394964 RepID=A0ABV7ZNW9_9CORY|nr:hypothetical protein [Corynebacterium hansenii]WJZ00537.1 hypothetical protein CHAN_09670 [Corynebacterium hansenii]
MGDGNRYRRRPLSDGIVAHARDALVEVRGDRLRMIRLGDADMEGPDVVLDVRVDEVLRTAWTMHELPSETGGHDGDGAAAPEHVLALDIILRDPEADVGAGPSGWSPLRMHLPPDAVDDVRAIRSAIHAGSARLRVAQPDAGDTVPTVPPPPDSARPKAPRADLAAAIERMAHGDAHATAGLAHLRHYPRPDEVVLEVMAATHADNPGILAVTTTRVLFVHAISGRPAAHEFPVDAVHSVEPVANEGERASAVKILQTTQEDHFIGVGHAHWRDVERIVAALRYAVRRRRRVGATLQSEPSPADAFRTWEELVLAARAGTIGEEEFDAKMSGVYWTAGF